MLWYIAIIGVINLGLGYLWGAYVRPCPRCAKARAMGLSLLAPPQDWSDDFRPLTGDVALKAEPVLEKPVDAVDSFELVTQSPTVPTKPLVSVDPATGLVTREHAEELLAQLSAPEADQSPLTVALVELAPVDVIGEEPDPAIDRRLLRGVSDVVRQSLADEHTLARFSDQQLLLLVPHENVELAARRAEEMRQRIATTEFMADGKSYQTTVTCALAEVAGERNGPKLFGFLQEALGEAKRYGGNRTFTHDGSSPTPVVPAELAVAPQQLAI